MTSDVPSSIALAKAECRKRARHVRAAAIAEHPNASLMPHWPDERFSGKIIGGYWPIKNEIDTRALLTELSRRGYAIALPAIIADEEPLVFRQWVPGDRLVDGPFKTLEPAPTAPVMRPDVVLVPMLAFNHHGQRVGYGGGFYDRTLSQLRAIKPVFACGIAFSAQRADTIPTDIYDQPLDGVLTEQGFMVFNGAP